MEKRLKKLFDYQRFKENTKLAKMIAMTERRYAEELSDDDISVVSAAGDAFLQTEEDDHDGGS